MTDATPGRFKTFVAATKELGSAILDTLSRTGDYPKTFTTFGEFTEPNFMATGKPYTKSKIDAIIDDLAIACTQCHDPDIVRMRKDVMHRLVERLRTDVSLAVEPIELPSNLFTAPVAPVRPKSKLLYITRLRNSFFSAARGVAKPVEFVAGGDKYIKLDDAATVHANLAMSETHECIFNSADLAAEVDRVRNLDIKS
jgi:hypothetical protein